MTVYLAHAPEDSRFAAELRRRLDDLRVPVWDGPRELRGGSKLTAEISAAIGDAAHVLVVLSPATVNSPQVRWEITKALEVERERSDGFRVIPVLLPGITPDALDLWFPERPLAVPVEVGPGGLSVAVPALLAALDRRSPTDHEPPGQPEAKPVEELVLKLTDPRIETVDGKRRVRATATLTHEPARDGTPPVESRRYPLEAPLGPIEAADLKWYLEDYHVWPVGVFRQRAEEIQSKLPVWGRELYAAALGQPEAREPLTAWEHAAAAGERRFSVLVDGDLPRGASAADQADAREAATALLTLPWELLHDQRGWLFQGGEPVRVRRRLPNRERRAPRPTALPVRILLVSPRPEVDGDGNPIGYIDHRVSARPLVEAVENLGELARLTVLQPPTYAALQLALQEGDQGFPYDVVHFDGHGVYDRQVGLGGLCFEDPAERERRRLDFVDATRLAGLVRRHRIPLMFLEACQTAMSEIDPTASVAARLLDEGVTSVVAMSHSVLVETARRFVQSFYAELARGARVGAAMLAGQQALYADQARGRVLGAGELRLQDWFVPVLYQEEQDPQLITEVPPAAVRRLEATRRQISLGELPEAPEHRFRGRSRELLNLERLLHRKPWAVVRGTGGQGKTTLAIELARWLVRTNRFERAAFVSLEQHREARAVLDTIGRQLVGPQYTVAQYPDLDQASQLVERALSDRPTIVVVDNCESLLPDPDDAVAEIFTLCRRLLDADPRTRFVFTTRESLPIPFERPAAERTLGALHPADAVELVAEVMKQHGWTPPEDDAGEAPQQITDLVEAVNRHARALVLLAREVAQRGVTATTADLRSLMTHLEVRHPGDRENSLYASVELSLRRLSPESRRHVRAVAVCHGGVHFAVLTVLTGLTGDALLRVTAEVIDVGLGEDLGDGHLRLDPGLAPYLLGELTAGEIEALREKWIKAMAGLTEQMNNDPDVYRARRLTSVELPNLVAMLDLLPGPWPPDDVVTLAHHVECLLENLGRPRALARAVQAREAASAELNGWSAARFRSDGATIDRLMERGDLGAVRAASEQLLARCLEAGEQAYPLAASDIAAAYLRLGRSLNAIGNAEAALAPLAEARRRFTAMTDGTDDRMISLVITEIGNSCVRLGRLSDAATAYEEAIELTSKAGELRDVAVNKAQLATVRLEQKRYDEALRGYRETLDTFRTMGEPLRVADSWYQIALVYQTAGQWDAAEQAHREALAIRVREDDVPGQANSLLGLGVVSANRERYQDAVAFLRQTAELRARMNDRRGEGSARGNLAQALTFLGRYDEARREIESAIARLEPFGHADEMWMAWHMAERLETAAGRAEEALAARRRARDIYLAYRRAGGESQARLGFAVAFFTQQALQHGRGQALQALNESTAPEVPPWSLVKRQIRAVLAGDRARIEAGEADLDFLDAAEIRLMIEVLDRDG
ncbi:tetratricopeptide (TPR) repeat protein [Actinoplanes octamycinicus]|uniref:Tetratricopeptide (TPR) repeat protein n=1 Tax=Actinoplanes octamycinicus TaxID=135948 RepID=A0A7W7H1Z0_9ACTN|nr:CHAT domain-containing protein [Actinoplanes octamycinicus]MBB4742498.1 tetratricopeptide (TPR) repeat protein [Actinoplanes octamycinicus]GIE60835.1 hypothetical protein Aoc01nite_62370 [Actinoplanes octamycinicus]